MTADPAEKIRLFVPWDEIEPEAQAQLRNTAQMPFVAGLAVMPDVHFGLGSTVGSVIASEGAVMPAAVGVDIGCGMIAAQTSLRKEDIPSLQGLRESIESQIPASAGRYNAKVKKTAQPLVERLEASAGDRLPVYDKADKRWREQVGTLGGGNHFIEVCEDEDGLIWLTLHSGSRGVGNRLASAHIKKARELSAGESLPDPDLAPFSEGTQEFDDYLADLHWAQEMAALNRSEMLARMRNALRHHAGEFETLRTVNCHHNYMEPEEHGGQTLYLTRKGAIRAAEGAPGLIPGSMGARSYVVEGLGNADSYCSAPHGAGRRMSRRKARETFTMDDFDRQLQGVEVRRSEAFLDEIPSAYKDIEIVMRHAEPLVRPAHTLKQILNVKGA